jgi:RNA polymerase subunit RPABC4/transcription elongation factor Spt4
MYIFQHFFSKNNSYRNNSRGNFWISFWNKVLIICLSMSFLGASPALAQGDLNAQLRTAVCDQNWGGAIGVVDRMVPLVPVSNPSHGQLLNYRQQLQNLQDVNLRLSNWACIPNQPIPALPQNMADNPNLANSSRGANPSPGNPFTTPFTPGVNPRANRSQDVEFWDGFLDIADPEAADIGRSLGQERLRQYAANVCSTLEQGGRMQDVPSIATGNILTTPEFELTLQEASISTYCPAQIDKLE